MKVFEIFKQEPEQWGLRGDPFLWREMAQRLADVDMPSTSGALRKLLEQTYEDATGHALSDEGDLYIERFKSHGMSSGGICTRFWQTKGIPLLVSRHA